MLLNQAIASQQSLYSEIQAQIEVLQEQQRQIHGYLQRLGSVESKMESAAKLLQEAISEIQNTCPDELPQYQDLITGLFGDKAIAHLEASIEPESPTPPTTPENPPSGDIEIDSENDINATITVAAIAVEDNSSITPAEGKEVATKPSERDFSRLTWKNLQKLAASYGASPKGKKRPELERELTVLGITQSEIDKVA